MSVSVEFIERTSEGLGISTTKEALRSLSVDVEYKIRDIIQVCTRYYVLTPCTERIEEQTSWLLLSVCKQGSEELEEVYDKCE